MQCFNIITFFLFAGGAIRRAPSSTRSVESMIEEERQEDRGEGK